MNQEIKYVKFEKWMSDVEVAYFIYSAKKTPA